MFDSPMVRLTDVQRQALTRLLVRLVDQRSARVLIEPQAPKIGFWFGGGNVAQDATGVLWLSGRYRNFGDSRLGVEAGQRGLGLMEISVNYTSLRITARDLHGGALIFLNPLMMSTPETSRQ